MTPATMRAARLHGTHDLRVETLPVPSPAAGEMLVRIEACGVCPTDVRKYVLGNRGGYPLNPGHEWLGRIEALGDGVTGWAAGQRVYGDTYAGYAELATMSVAPGDWSHGPLALPDDLALERAVFVEPLADCLHAVGDQARVGEGDDLVVVGAGQMGLQLIGCAAAAGVRVLAVEPRAQRRELALGFGAEEAVAPGGWEDAAREWSAGGAGPEAVIVSIGSAEPVARALAVVAVGGRVVLFAGFGGRKALEVDLEAMHYRELSLVGSEWIGAPPNQRRARYAEARALLGAGTVPVERLITGRCGLDGLVDAFDAVRTHRALKVILLPGAPG